MLHYATHALYGNFLEAGMEIYEYHLSLMHDLTLMDRRIRQGTGKGQLNGIFADRLEAIENDILINTFKQAIIDGTTAEELY